MGKIYACSDIHGQYEKYMKLWDIVTDDDELYIIGDVIDRGPDGMRILTDIMGRKNVTFIIGNHECMMYYALFSEDDASESHDPEAYDKKKWFEIWTRSNNGGTLTHADYTANYADRGDEIAGFLRQCPVAVDVAVGKKKYVLSHAMPDMERIGEVAGDRLFKSMEVDSIVWDSPFEILEGTAPIAVDEGRVMDAGDRFVFPLMDLQHVPAYLKPPIECWDENVTYIVGHVIVQRLSSPKMIRVPFYDNVAGDKKVVEFLDIDGGLAAYKHYGQGGLLDSLGLILYSLSDDKAIYL